MLGSVANDDEDAVEVEELLPATSTCGSACFQELALELTLVSCPAGVATPIATTRPSGISAITVEKPSDEFACSNAASCAGAVWAFSPSFAQGQAHSPRASARGPACPPPQSTSPGPRPAAVAVVLETSAAPPLVLMLMVMLSPMKFKMFADPDDNDIMRLSVWLSYVLIEQKPFF